MPAVTAQDEGCSFLRVELFDPSNVKGKKLGYLSRAGDSNPFNPETQETFLDPWSSKRTIRSRARTSVCLGGAQMTGG